MDSAGAHYLADSLLRKLALVRLGELTEAILNDLVEA